MYLQNIKIANFCNLETIELDFHPKLNVFTGNNGVGKTNILDAINYLCLTRSNFSRLDKYNIRHGQDYFRIKGNFQRGDNTSEITIKQATGAKKVVEKNKIPYKRLSEHIGHFPLVMIAPKDNVRILQNSEERRKLIDRVIAQTDKEFLYHLITYNKLLEQRNALLKTSYGRSGLELMLATYNEKMFLPAQAIYKARAKFIDELQPIFNELYGRIAENGESASVAYSSRLEKSTFAELMQLNLHKDMAMQRTTGGIHRDDIEFVINGNSVKNYASQGQLKSLVLAFKLAQFVYLESRTETTPIILLDDVFDKLDRNRVKNLVHLLFEKELGQVFITDTDEQRIMQTLKGSGLELKLFEVDTGLIKKVKKIS